eukprot:sb/3462866/
MDCVYVPLMMAEGEGGIQKNGTERNMEHLHKLASILQITAGNERGDVVLPVPLLETLLQSAISSSTVVVILETTVISWTKQIKIALKLDLEKALRAKNTVGPLAELQVWEDRQARLKSILDQLDSRLATQILKELSSMGNVYARSFTVVVSDIKEALCETEENITYLRPLQPYLEQLAAVTKTDRSIRIIAPIIHVLDLIWRHSRYYHEPKNFKRLLRHLSALVVSSAHRFVGEAVFSDTETAFVNLKHALKLCAKFRVQLNISRAGCYLDKREKCNEFNKQKVEETLESKKSESGIKIVTGPFITMHLKRYHGMFNLGNQEAEEKDPNMWKNSPWPPRNAPAFGLLNGFMERANDVLDLVQTEQHFKNLENVANIGGVGNRSLDTIVTKIHKRFTSAMTHFMSLTERNVLDTSSTDREFEHEFFKFRSLVRDLEGQMAHVIRICFDRCVNTSAHIRLLEVFAGVSGRESVQRSLSDKLSAILSGMMEEVLNVKTTLDQGMEHPYHLNMPSTASRVCWLRALRVRISKPMEKLRGAIPEILNTDEGWKLRNQYDTVIADIDDQLAKISSSWRREIKPDLTAKLTLNLFEFVEGGPLIRVNLDHTLLLVLKEVHYVTTPEDIPPSLVSLLEQSDPYLVTSSGERVLGTK